MPSIKVWIRQLDGNEFGESTEWRQTISFYNEFQCRLLIQLISDFSRQNGNQEINECGMELS